MLFVWLVLLLLGSIWTKNRLVGEENVEGRYGARDLKESVLRKNGS